MTRDRAIRLAKAWSDGDVCTLRDGEVKAYHALCLDVIREKEEGTKNAHCTNADRIRSMSDEEMATILGDKCICPPTGECTRQYGDCIACWLEWFQQPAKEDT